MRRIDSLVYQCALSIILICTISLLYSQTPENVGWYSQEPIAMTKSQCYNKALDALRSSGLSDLRTQDEWTASASNYNIRAGIMCVSVNSGVMISVSVAATSEYPEANAMRNYLQDYMLSGVSAVSSSPSNPCAIEIGNFGGLWTCEANCSGTKSYVDIRFSELSQDGRFTGTFLGPSPHIGNLNGMCDQFDISFTRRLYGRDQNWNGRLNSNLNSIQGRLTDPTHDPCSFVLMKK